MLFRIFASQGYYVHCVPYACVWNAVDVVPLASNFVTEVNNSQIILNFDSKWIEKKCLVMLSFAKLV